MLTTCTCDHCGQSIEFDAAEFQKSSRTATKILGQTISCPQCGKETTLFIDEPLQGQRPPPSAPPLKEPVVQSARTPGQPTATWGIIFLSIVSLVLIANGCSAELNAESVMHQIYGAIQFCSGFLLIGIALLINVIVKKA